MVGWAEQTLPGRVNLGSVRALASHSGFPAHAVPAQVLIPPSSGFHSDPRRSQTCILLGGRAVPPPRLPCSSLFTHLLQPPNLAGWSEAGVDDGLS